MEASKLASLTPRIRRQVTGVRLRARRRAFLRRAEVVPRDDMVALGTPQYGGWVVPASLLGPDAVCYLAGVGEDISFDIELIARFGCTVHALDPVPAAARFARAAAAHEPRHIFHEVGLWSADTTLHFHAPDIDGYVSHSATNIHGTAPAFEAHVRSLPSLMAELGHDRVDLLKISVEGSEFEIVKHVLDAQVPVQVICVEVAQPAAPDAADRLLARLKAGGYQLVDASVAPWNWKFTTVRG